MTRSRNETRSTSHPGLKSPLNRPGLRVVLTDGTEAVDLDAWARQYVALLLTLDLDAPADAVAVPQAA